MGFIDAEKEAYTRSSFFQKQGNDAFSGSAGDDKICIKEIGGVIKVNYIFGLVSLSERSDVINGIQSWLRKKGWEIGAYNIIGKECDTLSDVLDRIAFKDALYKFYFKNPVSILDREGLKWFTDSVEAIYSEKQKEIKIPDFFVEAESFSAAAVDELKKALASANFTKLQSISVCPEL